jgi:hypothetical protein
MKSKRHKIRSRSKLALGAALALAGLAGAGAATTSADAQGPIQSGAGPGWPVTVSPSDFVAQVTNPWFPLKPGSRYRYKGVKEGERMTDVVHVTQRTKDVLGVTTTVVHDVVSTHGRPEEVTDDYYAQDRATRSAPRAPSRPASTAPGRGSSSPEGRRWATPLARNR